MDISISTSEIYAVSNTLKNYDGKRLENYVSIAMNRAAKKVRSQLAKDISNELQIKQKIIRQRLQFFRKSKKDVKLWFGLNPVELDRLGKPKQSKSDVMIKGMRIENAFINKKGKITQRSTMTRPSIEINEKAQSLIKRRLPYYFREAFFKELNGILKWKSQTQSR